MEDIKDQTLVKPNCVEAFVDYRVEDPMLPAHLSKLNIFFEYDSNYVDLIDPQTQLSRVEKFLLEQIRVDDLVFLSFNKLPMHPNFNDDFRQDFEGDRMIEYLRDVANNYGMLAYVTKS